jgi:hypothetical protein
MRRSARTRPRRSAMICSMARGDGGGRDGRGEPQWRPLSDVDMMSAVVLEQLGANREQLRTLEPARRRPQLLDDHTVNRIKQVFGEQRDDMWLWSATGERWRAALGAQNPDAGLAAKVDQYTAAVEAFAVSNAAILAVADELARAHHRGDPGQTRPAARGGGAGLRRLPAGQPVPRRHRCPGPPPTGRGRRDCNFKGSVALWVVTVCDLIRGGSGGAAW